MRVIQSYMYIYILRVEDLNKSSPFLWVTCESMINKLFYYLFDKTNLENYFSFFFLYNRYEYVIGCRWVIIHSWNWSNWMAHHTRSFEVKLYLNWGICPMWDCTWLWGRPFPKQSFSTCVNVRFNKACMCLCMLISA